MSEHHTHEHSHHLELLLYFLGVILFVVALLIKSPIIENILYLLSLILAGYHVTLEGFQETIEDSIQNKRFLPNVHILMTLVAIGAVLINEYREAALLILIFAGAHFLEGYAESKSKKEITKLLALNPTKARLVKPDQSIELVEVETLEIGDLVKVLNGDQIPIDGIIIEGAGIVNQATITGESIPLSKSSGDIVFGGTINETGSFTLEVTKTSDETVLAKIITLVRQTQVNISPTAALIKKIEPIYVITVLLMAPLFFLFGLRVLKWDMTVSFYRTMIFLTGASPCALAVTDIPATLAAISNLARHGVLFKSGGALALTGDMKVIAFDKTGTLTKGTPEVTDFIYIESYDEAKKSYYENIIVAMEKVSNHPLATALLNYFEASDEIELDVNNEIGRGLKTVYNGNNYVLGKPEMVDRLSKQWQDELKELEENGKTVILFSENEKIIAIIALRDEPKFSATNALNYFKSKNVHTVLLTGDSKVTGEAIGSQLGVNQIVGDVLPEDKSHYINTLKKEHGIITMVGDGVNDAPALVAADVGLAMGNGTDIAIDVADGVLMETDLCRIAYVYQVSLKLKKIIIQNIFIALGVVVFLIVSNLLQLTSMPLVVVIHEGSTLLVILNGLRMLKSIYKNEEGASC